MAVYAGRVLRVIRDVRECLTLFPDLFPVFGRELVTIGAFLLLVGFYVMAKLGILTRRRGPADGPTGGRRRRRFGSFTGRRAPDRCRGPHGCSNDREREQREDRS